MTEEKGFLDKSEEWFHKQSDITIVLCLAIFPAISIILTLVSIVFLPLSFILSLFVGGFWSEATNRLEESQAIKEVWEKRKNSYELMSLFDRDNIHYCFSPCKGVITPCELREMTHYGEYGTGFIWCSSHGELAGTIAYPKKADDS